MSKNLSRSFWISCFGVLSLADLVLTWWLVRDGGPVYEGNPVAGWWLGAFGWSGLALFKAATVLAAAAALALLARSRPRAVRPVLACGCAVLALVVLYSGALAAFVKPDLERVGEAEQKARQESRRLDAAIARARAFIFRREQLCREVAAGRRSVAEAVAELEKLDATRDPDWLRQLRKTYRGRPVREALRAAVVLRTLQVLEGDPGAGQGLTSRPGPSEG